MITREDVSVRSMGENVLWNEDIHLFAQWLYGYQAEIKSIVEIGVATGGSADVWRKFMSEDGIYIGIDINLYNPAEFLYAEMEKVIKRFEDDKRMNFIIADSKAPETVARTMELLAGRPVDFLFIDGYHSYEYAKSDYELYAPMVRPGGIVAYHDATANLNVKKAIDEIVDVYWLNPDGSAGALPAIDGRKGLPFRHVVRFDAKKRHCGIIALVKE